MNENDELRKIEDAMRALGLVGAIRHRDPDDCIPRERFQVELACPGVMFGRVWGDGSSLATAYHCAMARREDALNQRVAA